MLGFRTACALAALVFFVGCDSSTDGQPLDPRPPEVSGFSFSPTSADFDDVLDGDSATVTLDLRVQAADDGAVDQVRYSVVWQFAPANTRPAASGTLEPQADGSYAATATLRLGRDERGRYTVLVYAVDDDGLLGNEARGIFSLEGVGLGPPVVEAVDGPAEFTPPGTLRFVATVSDPDGLGDVARVELSAPAGGVFQLFDDGRSFGDQEAGDGRYTASFDVPDAAPGPQTFVFRAFDRDGLASADVPFTVTILE